MKDRSLILLLVLPLIIAALFAVYRLSSRTPGQPLPSDTATMLREAARMQAEFRLGRELTELELTLIRVEPTPDGGWRATYDEPLHSIIPSHPPTTAPLPMPPASQPARN